MHCSPKQKELYHTLTAARLRPNSRQALVPLQQVRQG